MMICITKSLDKVNSRAKVQSSRSETTNPVDQEPPHKLEADWYRTKIRLAEENIPATLNLQDEHEPDPYSQTVTDWKGEPL
ncbi:hypothetical protein Tco_1500426 [Tanacetum coccineum]